MADLANGGTSMSETMSSAATRQPAETSRTRSVRVMGVIPPSSRHRADGVVRAVARCNAGAAGRDDRLHRRVCELPADAVAQQLRIVFHDRVAGDLVAGL